MTVNYEQTREKSPPENLTTKKNKPTNRTNFFPPRFHLLSATKNESKRKWENRKLNHGTTGTGHTRTRGKLLLQDLEPTRNDGGTRELLRALQLTTGLESERGENAFARRE